MAFDEMLDEHEQSERVLAWLRNNGAGIVAGIVLGLGAIYGWQWWKGHDLAQDRKVAALYSQTVDAFGEGRIPADGGRAALTTIDEASPILGTLAGLQLAKAQVEAGKTDAAIATLRGLKNVAPDLKPVVQQRLARLLIDAGKASEALPLLADEHDAMMLDARGDAELALGHRDRAQEAYRKALALVDVADAQHRLIAMKLVAAGGTPPHSEDNS